MYKLSGLIGRYPIVAFVVIYIPAKLTFLLTIKSSLEFGHQEFQEYK